MATSLARQVKRLEAALADKTEELERATRNLSAAKGVCEQELEQTKRLYRAEQVKNEQLEKRLVYEQIDTVAAQRGLVRYVRAVQQFVADCQERRIEVPTFLDVEIAYDPDRQPHVAEARRLLDKALSVAD